MTENQPTCVSQNGKAKLRIVSEVARIVRKHGLTMTTGGTSPNECGRYANFVRRSEEGSCPASLPPTTSVVSTKSWTRPTTCSTPCCCGSSSSPASGFRSCAVSKLADVDLENCKIFVNQGKGSKDRYVLFGRSFATALRTHIAAHPSNRWLFQTRCNTKFSTRRVQQIVKRYAEKAEVKATPHTFRHQAITWLTRHSGLADAELQLITGHARRETLAVYQHVALDGELEGRYQEAMKKVDL